MKRRFVRFVSGLLVAAMVMGIPVVSMAETVGTTNVVCQHTATGSNIETGDTVKPTCTEPGYTYYKCKLCGYEFRGSYQAFKGHNYKPVDRDEDGTFNKTEDVDSDGYFTMKCSTCGKSFRVHQDDSHMGTDMDNAHTAAVTNVIHVEEASCANYKYGYTTVTCSLEGGCGYEQRKDFEPPKAHTWSDWQITKNPTETEYGEATHACTVCGHVEKVKLDKEKPAAKMGRVVKDLVPVYTNIGDANPAFLVAKGCTFAYANDYHEGDEWVYVKDGFVSNYGGANSAAGYIKASNVEANPSTVPIYTGFYGLQKVATVKIDGNLNVRQGPDPTSAVIRTESKDTTLYVYRLEGDGGADGTKWGRISKTANEWIEMAYVSATNVFGAGPQLEKLSTPDPEKTKELQEVGTITAGASAVVRSTASAGASVVGTLPAGTKINLYKDDTDPNKPILKNSKGVATWIYVDQDEAKRLGLKDSGGNGTPGWIDISYVVLASVPGSGSAGNSGSSGSTAEKVIATGTVTSSINLNVRKEPEISVLNLLGSIPTGTKLEFYHIGDANGASWGKIKFKGQTGWVCMSYVQLDAGSSNGSSSSVTATPNATVVNCSVAVNVRDAADVSGKLLSTIPVNSRIAVTKLGDRWCFVNGKGWVCMDYVRLDAGAEDAINNANSSKPSDSENTGAVKTYTNVTVPATATANLKVYPNAVAKSGSERLTLVSGRKFTVNDRTIVNNKLWYKVTVGSVTGWVLGDNVKLPAISGTVTSTTLNVYAGKTTDSEVKYTLGNGTKVTILENGQWTDGVYVWGKLADNSYVQMNYLSLNVPAASGQKGTSVGSTAISGRILKSVMVKEEPGTGVDLVQLEKGYTVTIKTWYYDSTSGKTYGKVSVGEDAGWIDMDPDILAQDEVSGKVSVDVLSLYTDANTSSATTLSLRKNNSITVKERKLVGTAPWGMITVKNGSTEGTYWINLSGTTLGTYSIDPTTPTESNNNNNNNNNNTNTGTPSGSTSTGTASGTIANTEQVNVRTAAGVRNALATTLKRGTPVTVYEQKTVDDALWGRIDQGWVAMTYVDLSSKGNTGNSTVSSGSIGGNTILTSVPSGAVAVGFVNIADLTVRNGAGLGYTKTGKLAKNTNVVIYEQVLKDGMIWGRCDKGWICTSYVTITGTSVTGSGTAGTVARCFYTANVRSAPGVGNALVGKVMVNSRIEIYEQQSYSGEMWGRTSIGWIAMQYVLTDGSLPVA